MLKLFMLAAFMAANLAFGQVTSIPTATGGGASTFDNIGSGTNTSATMTCGAGCTLVTTAGIFRLPNGTSAPGTCTVGDAFFDTDATAGSNMYGCTATDTWTLLSGGGGGASAVTDLTDLKATSATTVLTVAAGNVQWTGTDGVEFTTSVGSGTITINDAPAGDTGTIRVAVAYNSGTPILKCYYSTGITWDASYTVSSGFTGSTCTSANAFSVDDIPVASVAISAGAWSTITDLRSAFGASRYTAGTGLSKSGNVFSLGTFTLKTKIALPITACSGTTGTLMWDTLASNAPTATCSAGSTETTMMRGVGDWPDSDGDYSVQTAFLMPDDWDTTAALDAIILWRTTATSGNAVFQIQTACRADAEVDDVAWNTASTVTDAAKGTANQLNSAAITGITKTGCEAGELLHVRLLRNRTHASDTLAAALSIGHVELTARRSITQ